MRPAPDQIALYAFNTDITRARTDYHDNPTRACRWVDRHDDACDQLRDDDLYYCPRHRKTADEVNARRRARKEAA